MSWLLIIPAMVVGAVAYRVRGGLLEVQHLPGSIGKVCFATALGFAVILARGDLPLVTFAASVLGGFIGATIGNFGAIDAGRREGDVRTDFLLNTLHGMLEMAPIAAFLLLAQMLGYTDCTPTALPMLLGAGMGVIYELTARYPRPFGLKFGWSGAPNEFAEVLTGALFAGAVFVTVHP